MKRHVFPGLKIAALFACLLPLQAPAATPKTDLVWGSNLPRALDPHVVYDVPMQFFMLNTYDTLYRYEGNPPRIQPWLAESHTVSADGLTWTFKLKDGVVFHDGRKLTAADVAYSFRRVLTLKLGPASAFSAYLKPEGVTAPDARTVKFVLSVPYAPFLAAVPLIAIVNQAEVKTHESDGDWGSKWLASNEAGSGAYTFDIKTYRPQEIIDLYRFPKHFMGWKDNPNPVEVVRAHTVKETSTRVLALLRGDIDATDSYLPTDQVERLKKAKDVTVAEDESMRTLLIRMNNSRPPFDNLHFRKCLSQAFNYDGFIKVILKGYAVRNPGPIPRNLWGAPADLAGYSFDLKKAKAECDLAKAEGAPIGRKLDIYIMSEFDQSTQTAQVLQADARKIGLDINIVPSTWANLTTMMGKPETTPDMWVHWVSTYFVDPENWIGQMYDSHFHGSWKASSWYTNPKVDSLLAEARRETDQGKRKALYEEASRLVVADAADIWIYNTIQLRGLTNRIKGYRFSPVGSGGEIRWISIQK